MSGRYKRGFSLIEVVIVMAIIAISLGMAGPRIGAGIGRLELNQAAQTVRSSIKFARLQAQRFDREQYIVLNRSERAIAVLNRNMEIVREHQLPGSVDIVLDEGLQTAALYVAPSGILRGRPVRLRGRTGEIEVALR